MKNGFNDIAINMNRENSKTDHNGQRTNLTYLIAIFEVCQVLIN